MVGMVVMVVGEEALAQELHHPPLLPPEMVEMD
jgi:hypothetical protein